MRRSEREARVVALIGRLFADTPRERRRVLTVDFGLRLDTLDQMPATAGALVAVRGPFEGALVGLDAHTNARALVNELYVRLGDGAAVLVMAPLHPSVGERARGLLTRTPPPRVSRAAVCEALLGAGMITPRLHDDAPGLLLVSARVPARRTPLDAFFAQPS